MYLSRLAINPRSRDARRDIGDVYRMHQRVMSAFPRINSPGDARTQLAVLHRLDVDRRNGAPALLVQSGVKPDWNSLPDGYLSSSGEDADNPAVKSVAAAFESLRVGQQLQFRLLANPTRKIDTKTGPDGRRRHGRRVGLETEAEQLEWLARKAEQGGFHLLPVRPDSAVPAVRVSASQGYRGDGRSGILTIVSTLFEGLLEIDHADRFRRALKDGIGPSRSFGCGLISVASPRRHV